MYFDDEDEMYDRDIENNSEYERAFTVWERYGIPFTPQPYQMEPKYSEKKLGERESQRTEEVSDSESAEYSEEEEEEDEEEEEEEIDTQAPPAAEVGSSDSVQEQQDIPTGQDHGDAASLLNLEPNENIVEASPVTQRGARASLSDLSSEEEIESLTVRQLKEILARNFVNYSGCCEKWELVERVHRLYRENEQNRRSIENVSSNSITAVVAYPPPICNGGIGDEAVKAQLSSVDENLCRICMDAVIDCVLLECGHMVTCTKCGKRMSECPICRQYVVRAVHVFKS